MINLISAIEWDSNAFWALIGTLVGAVLGFLSSIIIDLISKKWAIHKLLDRLKLELSLIKKSVSINLTSPGKIEFASPIWNFIGQTNILLDMKKTLYEKIINIYGGLRFFIENEEKGNNNSDRRKELLKTIENNAFWRGEL